jgi:hypothetical protein
MKNMPLPSKFHVKMKWHVDSPREPSHVECLVIISVAIHPSLSLDIYLLDAMLGSENTKRSLTPPLPSRTIQYGDERRNRQKSEQL